MLQDFFSNLKIGLPELSSIHLVGVVHLDDLEQDLSIDDDEAIGPSISAERAEMDGRVPVQDVADEVIQTKLDLAPDVNDGLVQLLGLPVFFQLQLPDFLQSPHGCVPPFGSGPEVENAGGVEGFAELHLGVVKVLQLEVDDALLCQNLATESLVLQMNLKRRSQD